MNTSVLAVLVTWIVIGASLDAARQRRSQTRRVFTASVTSYCTSGTTDAGTRTRRGTAAADPRVLPFGSRIRIEGLTGRYNGTYLITDSGRAIRGTDLDIFIADCAEAKRFGRQRARVRVVRLATTGQTPQEPQRPERPSASAYLN